MASIASMAPTLTCCMKEGQASQSEEGVERILGFSKKARLV